MSDIAESECGCEGEAWQFRDEYLRTGVTYSSFRCAYCHVKVHARAIYGDAFKRAPHFYVKNPDEHKNECPWGESPVIGVMRRSQEPKKLFGNEVYIPEVLTRRRRPTKADDVQPRDIPTTDADRIKNRVLRISMAGIIGNHSSTSLLSVIVRAQKAVVSDCCREAANRKLKDAERNKLIRDTLKGLPLKLYERCTDYGDGIRSCKVHPWKSPLIYYGKGRVVEECGGYRIYTDERVKVQDTGEELGFQVRVVLGDEDSDLLRRRLFSLLDDAAASGGMLDWIAYGEMTRVGGKDLYELTAGSVDHLHIEKPKERTAAITSRM